MIWYTLKVKPSNLKSAIEKIQEPDSMGGAEIQRIDLIDSEYHIIFTREYSYSFITNELFEIFMNSLEDKPKEREER